jgi:hypothetical protein
LYIGNPPIYFYMKRVNLKCYAVKVLVKLEIIERSNGARLVAFVHIEPPEIRGPGFIYSSVAARMAPNAQCEAGTSFQGDFIEALALDALPSTLFISVAASARVTA